MSDENFLGRWSRRKGEAKTDAPPQATDLSDKAQQASASAATGGGGTEPEIDLSVLPPIDSITAVTDITAFLRKGIPPELARAALRRAWTTDPAIRDFVGLAENAWDFNDPNAMPGFGPLECTKPELDALLERVVGASRKIGEDLAQALSKPPDLEANSVLSRSTEHSSPEEVADQRTAGPAPPSGALPDHVATQPQVTDGTDLVQRRTHGGALPR